MKDISGCSGTVKFYDQYPDEPDPTAPPHLVSTTTYNGNYTSPMDTFITADWYCGSPVVPDVIFGVDAYLRPNCTLAGVIDWWNAGYGHDGHLLPSYTDLESYPEQNASATYDDGLVTDTIKLSWSRTGTTFTFDVEYSSIKTPTETSGAEWNDYCHFHGSVTLSDPYTAAEWLQDLYDAMNAWDLSDGSLSKFRTDEKLALAQLCCYDEVPYPVSPFTYHCPTMNDLNNPVADSNGTAPWTSTHSPEVLPWVYDSGAGADWQPTFGQIAWIDSNDYIWKYGNGQYGTGDGDWPTGIAYPGATLISGPMRDGSIISHTTSGSDRHFWFNY